MLSKQLSLLQTYAYVLIVCKYKINAIKIMQHEATTYVGGIK